MRTGYIDDDTAERTRIMLDILMIYKMVQDRGYFELDTTLDFTIMLSADDEDWFCMYHEILEGLGDIMFGTLDIECHEPNCKDDEIAKYFPECAEFFDYDNDGGIYGLAICHPSIIAFYKLCEENGIDVLRTPFAYSIAESNNALDQGSSYECYCEIFVHQEKEVRDKYPVCLFYTDPSLFNSSALLDYYDALDYCDYALSHPEEIEKLKNM